MTRVDDALFAAVSDVWFQGEPPSSPALMNAGPRFGRPGLRGSMIIQPS